MPETETSGAVEAIFCSAHSFPVQREREKKRERENS